MQLFYSVRIEGNTAILGEEESWHCTRVLRMQEGSPVRITDGQGLFCEAILSRVHQKESIAWITRTTRSEQRRPWRLHLAIAPPKNIDRFEWFLEKATEIGIDEITPLFSEHSERKVLKMPRLEKVLVAAMKQSLKCWLPLLHEPSDFGSFISRPSGGQLFIAWCSTGRESLLHNAYTKGSDTTILVGPEGDFSQEEAGYALKSGYVPVSLGDYRLRTETAGIAICRDIELLNMK